MSSPLGGQFRTSLLSLLAAIEDLHCNMLTNSKRGYYDRIPSPLLAYALPHGEAGDFVKPIKIKEEIQ
ncbi:hypothetical protein KL86DPRO_10366 [uncultured delta proteobacterium]|uniref:Uncharacterized protein n=1 Tax=uncultured delta proteobacterium TaxID=34034 RepID=A0A212IZ57_9DELT|nr:hypothetical protein KL86DPRO_10366 [uncultured delta proteobacterium]